MSAPKNNSQQSWVIYSHSSDLGGAELSLLEVVKPAFERGISLTLILPREGPLQAELEAIGVTEIVFLPTHTWMTGKFPRLLGIPRLILIGRESSRFSRFLREIAPDLLIVNTSTIPGPVRAGYQQHIPTAVFVHEGIRSNRVLTSLLPKPWIIGLLNKWADLFIVPSEYVGQELGSEYLVSAPAISKPKKNIKALIELHQQGPHNPLRAVMLGRISREKGHLDAIAAVKLARQQGINVQLSMYGDVDSTISRELSNMINSEGMRGVVFVHPPQKDIDSIFANADLTLVLSKYETYGRVAAESLTQAVPVIGLDIPTTREMLAEGGGVLVSDPIQGTAELFQRFTEDHSGYRNAVSSIGSVTDKKSSAKTQTELFQRLIALTH
ncbi:MAG: glycosyltransferase family 4 protein [Aurantimicrobium sp.]